MQRSRLLAIGATLALVAATVAGGGAYLLHGTPAHAAAPSPYLVSSDALSNSNVHAKTASVKADAGAHGKSKSKFYPGISNIDSLANFSGLYRVQGQDPTGAKNNTWYYNTVGNDPKAGGTTNINAPVVPVTVNLLDKNGNTIASVSPDQYVNPTLNSPVFQNATYSSSDTPTQFTDALQRAEYYKQEASDWHTLLVPSAKTGRTMSVPYGSYFYALNKDGSIRFVLVNETVFGNLLFPATATDTTTPIGAAENAGDIATKDISTFLFPNTFLYSGNDPFAPGACCIIGYHTYDFEPGTPSNGNLEQRYVVNFSSWMSPGIFGGGVGDVTALSHEIAETFNDPFVTSDNIHNVTPWWLAPNGNCQNDLETGDVIEGLPNEVYPMTMNGMTYHPQNEAMLQWFESKHHSDAIDGAFSYPNESVLTSANVSQVAGCTGPA